MSLAAGRLCGITSEAWTDGTDAMVGPASSDDSFDALGQPGDSLLKRIYLLAPHIGTGQGRLLLDLAKRDAIERRSSRLLLSV